MLFVGDSITYSGQYIEIVETWLRLRYPGWKGEVSNAGLPSETVSGLSEDGHAGGQFPRPNLHERLGRLLAAVKPDLVIACYGMNDGIYLDWDDARFMRYRDGIEKLREVVLRTGSSIVHVTPPTFDPPAGTTPAFEYNRVLDRYSEWLVSKRRDGWTVIDLHSHMNQHLAERRSSNPAYRLAPDGVHPTEAGHWVIAQPLLEFFGASERVRQLSGPNELLSGYSQGQPVFGLVKEKQRLMKDAWLTQAGHLRPGMKKGLPLPEARSKEELLNAKIRELLPF